MPKRTLLGRADLLACLEAYGEERLDGLAEVLGYSIEEPKPTIELTARASASASATVVLSVGRDISTSAEVIAAPKARFYRVIAQRELDPAEIVDDEPDWLQKAKPYQADDPELLANPEAKVPPTSPLVPWSRLWPFLKLALGALQPTRSLDVRRAVERLARGKPLRKLPRRRRKGWASECQIVIDYANPLLPFWDDFNQLVRRLRQPRGSQGLMLLSFPDGVPGGRCWRHDGKDWREIENYREPLPGTPVLVLSDLGCNDSADTRRRQWRRFGNRLRRADCRPVALMPSPARWRDAELSRLFYPVGWDRAVRLPRRLGTPRVPPISVRTEQDAGAEKLLTLLAPAIRVEPALLRAVRYLLPVRDADVGSEFAAWNQATVHPTPLAFYFDPTAIPANRERFRNESDTALRQQVCVKINEFHSALSPAIHDEERRYMTELGVSVPIQDKDEEKPEARFVRTLLTQSGELADSIRAYVHRMTPRQHKEMWQDPRLAALWGAVNIPEKGDRETLMPPEGLALESISWLLGRGQSVRQYTLRQRGQVLWIEASAPPATPDELESPGSPVAEISARALYVQISDVDAEGDLKAVRWQPLGQPIPLPASDRLQLRTDRHEITIESFQRPEWAEAVGRDERGLFISWASNEQSGYWVSPGTYPIVNRAGEYFGQLTFANGYWCSVRSELAPKHLLIDIREQDRAVARQVQPHRSYVFINYSREDSVTAQRIKADLEARGFACWMDTSNLVGGELWGHEIEKALHNAVTVISLVSQRSKDSRWVRRGLDLAEELKKTIIPIRIESVTLPLRLRDLQGIDCFAPRYDTGLEQLVRVLKSQVEQSHYPQPPQLTLIESYGQDKYGIYADIAIKGVTQRLRWIAPGEFEMGSPASEAERGSDETLHHVILTCGYWLADTACTQALWQAVMGKNPSGFKGAERPVEKVSWNDAQQFIERLSQIVPGGGFRLPTEAEWEYACRAGTTTPFWFGEQITPEKVNYNGNYPYQGGKKGLYREETVEVKALPCNGWGLYQMHGNVWEWCADWYSEYPATTVVDPSGPVQGVLRVLRGGSWFGSARDARSAYRVRGDPADASVSLGFRLARGQVSLKPVGPVGESQQASSARQPPRSEGGQARRSLLDRIFGRKRKP